MCLVSRRLSYVSRPLLYHTVLLRDAKSLYRLFWTLCRRPKYGRWARWFACNFVLEEADRKIHDLFSDNETVGHFRDQVSRLHDVDKSLSGGVASLKELLREHASSPAAVRGTPEVLFGLVLRFLTRVETLWLTPRCGLEEALYGTIRAIQHMPRDEPHAAPFQHIRVLCGRGDGIHPRDKDDFSATVDFSATGDNWAPLLALFNLEIDCIGMRLLRAEHVGDPV
jgi:hypothetical protein